MRRRGLLRYLGVDLHAGEGRAVLPLFFCFLLIVTFQYVAKTIRQTTFVDSLGAVNLPWAYLAVAVCSVPLLLLYERFVGRARPGPLTAGICWIVAASSVGFWWLFDTGWSWVPVVFYVWITLTFGVAVSQFWSLSNRLLDARQAKRLFGLIGAGGLLGGIAGGQVARLVAAAFEPRAGLLAAAGVLAVAALLARFAGASAQAPLPDSSEAGERSGLQIVLGSRHLKLIGLVLVLSIVVAQIVDLQFNWAVERTTAGLADRAAFFGNFFSATSVAAFVFQLLFTARIHRTAGVASALRILPVVLGLGTVALLVVSGMFPEMLIAVALVLKVGDGGLRHSLDQSTRELLFLPVPESRRAKAKAFIDLFVQRSARGVAALLLLPVTFGLVTPVRIGVLTLILAVVWIVAATALYRVYVHSFRQGLKERSVDTAVPINLDDAKTVELLVQSLGSTDARQVLHSLDILEANERSSLVPPLLLYHDDAEVRRRTLGILAKAERTDAAALVERRLQDDHPDVRAEAIRVLTQFNAGDACSLMRPRLNESDPRVRAAAVACLATHGDEEMAALAGETLTDMLSDGAADHRAEAARAIGAIHGDRYHGSLLRALEDPEPAVAREAVLAVERIVARDGFQPLFVPRLVSMLRDRRLKLDAREALIAFGEPAVPILVHFMNDAEESIFVRRALPKALSRIGGREAVRALVAALSTIDDGFLRAQLVEALAMVRDEVQRSVPREAIERAIEQESRRGLERLSEVAALGVDKPLRFDGAILRWDARELDLLTQMVAERMEEHLHTLFGLLALLYTPKDVWAGYRSLLTGQPGLRAHALEYLDNTLEGDIRRTVFAVIDHKPVQEKLAEASRAYGIRTGRRLDAVRGVLAGTTAGNADAVALVVAGLYTVYTERLSALYPQVERWRGEQDDPLIHETAAWVAERVG
jgi:AAA family ATP:ADP antiporter